MKNCDEMVNNLFERREQYVVEQKRKRNIIIRMTSSICCVCLVAFMGFGVWQSGILKSSEVIDKNDSNNTGFISPTTDETDGESLNSSIQTQYSVYTDSIKLPENTSDMMMDMIGCLVYKGKVYTQSTGFYTYDSVIAEQLVGEYVGEATGILEEWSSQEEWATEFASTYSGSVYKVNGYSEDFRLCIYVNSGDEQWLQFLDNYDGIGLNTGADLFENRLHITGNVESVTYLTHYDWNEGNPSNHRDLTGITEEQFEDFLVQLCDSPFERIEYSNNPNFYDSKIQGHLYLNMKDGTLVELRLIEGGYVGCQSLGWIFVKMPGELFDVVLAACQ